LEIPWVRTTKGCNYLEKGKKKCIAAWCGGVEAGEVESGLSKGDVDRVTKEMGVARLKEVVRESKKNIG